MLMLLLTSITLATIITAQKNAFSFRYVHHCDYFYIFISFDTIGIHQIPPSYCLLLKNAAPRVLIWGEVTMKSLQGFFPVLHQLS